MPCTRMSVTRASSYSSAPSWHGCKPQPSASPSSRSRARIMRVALWACTPSLGRYELIRGGLACRLSTLPCSGYMRWTWKRWPRQVLDVGTGPQEASLEHWQQPAPWLHAQAHVPGSWCTTVEGLRVSGAEDGSSQLPGTKSQEMTAAGCLIARTLRAQAHRAALARAAGWFEQRPATSAQPSPCQGPWARAWQLPVFRKAKVAQLSGLQLARPKCCRGMSRAVGVRLPVTVRTSGIHSGMHMTSPRATRR